MQVKRCGKCNIEKELINGQIMGGYLIMDSELYIPLLLLNLTKRETELLLVLYLIYENKDKKEKYTIEEIGKLVGMTKLGVEDTLNKLMIRNIVGRIIYKGVINHEVKDNFDEDFLAVLYDKKNPLVSSKQKTGFYIDFVDRDYILNPVIKSWKYIPKVKVVSILKRLKKILNNEFIEYLLNSFNNGEKGDKRQKANSRLNGWDIKQVVEIFKSKYKINYGNSYNAGTREYSHMKKLLIQLSNDGMPKNNMEPFLDYAFSRALDKDYVLQIAGLKYYANEYLTNIVRNTR